jgi:hypothetical protein
MQTHEGFLWADQKAVYEAFSKAVIGLAEDVLCTTREAPRQHLSMGGWKYQLGCLEKKQKREWAAYATAHCIISHITRRVCQ